jgi:hypothetical protein
VLSCRPVPCGGPPLPTHGGAEVTVKDGLYWADYYCRPGYRLVGADRLLCRPDSSWQFGM